MDGQLEIIGKEKANYVLSTFKDIPDFPKKGIVFKDIMGAVADPKAFQYLIDAFIKLMPNDVKYIVGIEARGFILGAALAQKLGLGFVPLRKKGKLAPPVESYEYSLEYGEDTLEIQKNRIEKGDSVFVIDDVIATGGTIEAAKILLENEGAEIKAFGFVIELTFFNGIKSVDGYDV
ncbi:MAG: adenine phosphoribosyltransferase, partial [Bifidobacteriaceae bacterium]|nr:adenine phosphoribosyltransferase [Bifidobacteriaceae bacterium]